MNADATVPTPSAELLGEEAARELTHQIRGAVVRTIEVLGEVDDLVARAYAGRAWVALGFASWEAYCAHELSGARLWQAVSDRQATTLRLRGAGLSERAVAAVLGVGAATVHRDLVVASTASAGAVDRSTGLDGRTRPAVRQDSEQARRRMTKVLELRAQGCTQTQIAEQLGVAQSTVSAHLSAAAARGALDPSSLLGVPVAEPSPDGDVHDVPEPALMPSRAHGLLTEAVARAHALAGHAGALREVVVDSDEWTSDPLLAADVADAVTGSLVQAAGDLAYVLAHLDAAAPVCDAPESAHVHVARARRVREIAEAVAAGTATESVASRLGIAVDVVAGVVRQVAALPEDRRARTGALAPGG